MVDPSMHPGARDAIEVESASKKSAARPPSRREIKSNGNSYVDSRCKASPHGEQKLPDWVHPSVRGHKEQTAACDMYPGHPNGDRPKKCSGIASGQFKLVDLIVFLHHQKS